VSRKWSLILVTLVLAGCAKKAVAPPTPAPTEPVPAPPPKEEPAPKPAQLQTGPIYLLAPNPSPLWPGPAAVVVENSLQSRPQSGLLAADVVFESLAESEVTRYLALFWSQPAAKIGPVRSARTYTVAIADAYGAPYSHAGGNNDALAVLRQSWGPRNLDEIYGSGEFFWRSTDRVPPNNLYISTDLLGKAIATRKLKLEALPTTPRGPEGIQPPVGDELTAKAEINWHKLHTVTWEWDGKQYRRLEEGATPHKVEGGAQIGAPNLVFLTTTGTNHGPDLGWSLNLDQGGKATVLTGGRRWDGAWSLGPGGFKLQPAAGAQVPALQPGLVWVNLIAQESSFTVGK
jgi:hypothetical protein